jgi:Uma2 family endonuclease
VTQPGRRPARYEDVLALPENQVGEIVAGVLYASPRPAGPHTVAGSSLGGILIAPFNFGDNGPGGWWILFEPELHLGDDVLVPDLAGWRRERMPEAPAGAFIELPPDWVAEVLSPSTARLDRIAKLPVYARAGVQHVWLIDPLAKMLEALRVDGGKWTIDRVFGGNDVVRVAPFDAVEVKLARLWGDG